MTADYEKLKRKHLNAIKHGVFSSMAILPGEDLDEYGALLEAFSSEWSPEGPTEVDAVYTLTNCVWGKRRIRKSIAQKVELRSLDPDHPAFDPDLVLGPANVAFQLSTTLRNCLNAGAYPNRACCASCTAPMLWAKTSSSKNSPWKSASTA
jgi:hypothetical protein